MKHFVGLLLAAAVSLTGCASSKLTTDQRAAFKHVSIGKVELPDKPTIFGGGSGLAFLLAGPIGLSIANAGSDVPTEFKKALERSGTDVSTLLRADLATRLAQSGFEVVADGDARANVVLETKVLQYGLTGDIFASEPVRIPALWIRIDLKKAGTNETLWWHWASVHAKKEIADQLESRLIPDYFTDGVLLRRNYEKASALVTEEALSKL